MLLNQAKCSVELATGQSVVLSQVNFGFQPEFSFPVGTVNVHM
jgi:hypothetical protein